MPNVNFYLKKAEQSGSSLIYLQFKYAGKKLVFSFAQTIRPSNWNARKQRVKSNSITTVDGKYSLNDLLDNLEKECLKAYNRNLKNGIPSTVAIKEHLQAFINQNKESEETGNNFYQLAERFTNNEIKNKGNDKSGNTIKTYRTLLGHLKEFEAIKKYKISFDSINLDFYYKYVDFLRHRSKYASQIKQLKSEKSKTRPIKDLDSNSISKDSQILKVFMAEAFDLGLTNNLEFKHKKFAVTREETDAVFLTDKEILKIYHFDFSPNKRKEQVRDLFVFGCFVGLRFSDYSNVQPENIVEVEGELFIKLITAKTNELVIIPCNPVVLEIFGKYGSNKNRLPSAPSNQKFNDYIKEVCKELGLNEKGRLSTEPTKELWECITSHTARRSFATNLYLAGFPSIDLMKITGHRTEKAFMKYIRITKLDTAKRLSMHIKKNWSEMLLRVVG